MLIYSDDYVLAVNKKCGEAAQPGPSGALSVITELEKEFGKIYPVHRIDTPASGVLLFARTSKSAAMLGRQFSAGDGSIIKTYVCAVDSPPPADEGRLEDYIHIPSAKKVNKVYIRKQPDNSTVRAILDYRLVCRTDSYHILEIKLITGRKHQIRAQLSNAGCHIKGDVKYGARRTNRGGGIHLHALSLSFRHPGTGDIMVMAAPLPEDPIWNVVRDEIKLPAGPYQQDKQNNNYNYKNRDCPFIETI